MKKASSSRASSAPVSAPSSESDGARIFEAIRSEVRRPLDGMLAVTELLQRQPLTPDAQAYVKTLSEHQQVMLRVLADAADLVRAETGQLDVRPEPIELRPLMDSIQQEWSDRAPKSGVALSISYDGADLCALLDAQRLRQVFFHLIKRALSATRRGGVEASLHARREAGQIALRGRVRDSGALLAGDALEGLFDGGGEAGDRINMRLCRRLIEAMGGAIAAENNTGAGCTVTFDIVAEEAQMEAEAEGEAAAARGAHVLVVDDNATNRMVAEALCEMFDCTSESAEDGFEAVEAARSGRFDLILMDIKMPRMDGIEATRMIRAMAAPTGETPIVALTANADPEDVQSYLAAGMTSVVEKPIKPEALLAAMNACLPEVPSNGGHAAAA